MRLAHLLRGFRLDAQFRRRAQQQARQPDRFAGFPAVAVLAVLQPCQRRIDFRQQAAFAIQLAEQQAQLLFARRLVGFIARRFAAIDLFFQLIDVQQQLLPLILQQLAEKRPLNRVHIIRIRHGQQLLRIR